MSKTIDEKVVEMRFDNSHFEKHTRETISTLDKLKQKLNLTGASKGLENLNTSANKVNMSGMSSAIDTVHSKFSALEVMGVTALANITNSAVNAGKRIISALTIDPVRTGFQEYETQLNAVQTIMANVKHKGKTLDDVNNALDELNKYADQTIYNFTEMTRNIGLFTNAGVDLDTSVAAIKGFSNAAAMAGTNATDTSRAMYQLSQAMSSGSVKLMDWKSLETANITGERFQETVKETAKVHGINVDEMIKKEGSFRETLKSGWLTADLMAEALNHYTLSRETMTEAEQEAAKAQMLNIGYTEEQINKLFDLGTEASNAATKVKSFTQLWGVLKESAQSGWAKTWQIIIGDFEEAKALFSPLANFLTGVIDTISTARNELLEGALGKGFKKLGETIKTVTDPIKNTVDTVNSALEDMDKMVNQVIRGDWGNGEDRFKALTEAGHNYYAIQNKVNETLGCAFRYSDELVNSQNNLNKAQEKSAETQVKLSGTEAERLEQLIKMSDAELEALGLTKEQIDALKELKKYSEMTGISIADFIANIDEIDGRWLLINSFKNAGQGLVAVFKAMKDAWAEIFPPMSSDQLFNIIAGLHKFSTYLVVGDETADKLKRTLKGLFAALDIILTLVTGPFKLAGKILLQLLQALDIIPHDVLGITAVIGDAIVAFRDWLDSVLDFTGVFETLAPYIKNTAAAIRDWIKGLVDGVPGDILSGLANGLKNGASKVIEGIVTLATKLIEAFENVLEIHSPSRVFFAIGGFIIAGLIGGLLAGETKIGDTIGGIASKIAEFFGNINWSKIFSAGMSVGLLLLAKKVTDIMSNISAPFAGVGDLLSGVGEVLSESAKNISKILKNTAKVVKSFSKVLKGFAFKQRMEGIKELAIALLILVGAIVILTQLDTDKMWEGVKVILALAVILAILSFAMNKISQSSLSITKDGVKATGVKTALLSIGLALLAMAAVVKMLGGMSPDQIKQGFIGLAGAVIALGALLAAYGFLIKGKGAQNMDKAGKMIRKMATTLLLMAVVVKLVSFLKPEEMLKGAAFAAGFTAFVWALMLVTKGADKNIDKLGSTILKISLAMLLMIGVINLISNMEWSELGKGAAFAAGFTAFVWALVSVTKIGKDKQIAKIGSIMLGVSAAMLIMVGVIKLISIMEWDALAKGAIGIIALGGIIAGLMYMVKVIGPEAPKLAATLIAMGIAIGILAAVAIVLSLIDIPGLVKGITAVGLLASFMALMIYATKGAQEIKGTLIVMTVAIGILAAAVAALSFIDWKKLLPATAAMATLMGMFALIESQAKHVVGAWGTLLIMTALIAVLAGALYQIAQLPIENSLAAAGSLSMLLLSLAGTLKILTMIGPAANAAYPAMGALAVLLAGLLAVVAILGGINKIPGVKEFLSGGIDILVLLAEGIGKVIGAIIGGIGAQVSSYLPEIGANLSMFMTNLTPFLAGIKMVDGQVLAGVGILTATIIALTAANLINGITSFLPFVGSFAELGTELSMFMVNALPFLALSKQIDPAIMEGVKALAEAILILTGANLLDTINIFSGSSLEKFAVQLPILGQGLKDFITAVGPVTEDQVTTANNAATIVKTLAKAAQEIPNTGGLLAQLVGDNDMAAWATQLPIMGAGIASFIKIISDAGIDSSAVDTANTAAQVISTLAKAASEIPNTGGLLASLIGDNDLTTFANQLPNVGKGIVGFIKAMSDGGITEDKASIANTAAAIIKTLAQAASEIPNAGGWLANLIGDNDLGTFAAQLPNVGKGIAGFAKELGEFGDDKLSTVYAACTALQTIVNLANIDIKDTGDDLEDLGKNMVNFAKKIKEFVNEIGNVGSDGIQSAIEKTKDLIDMASTVASVNVDSLKTFGKSLKDIAKDGVKGFVEEFTGDSPKSKAKKAVEELVDAGIKGAKDKKNDAKDEFKKLADKAVEGLDAEENKKKATQAGKDLCQGLINGLKNEDKKKAVYNAAFALGQLAVQGEKDGQKSNSPSKATEQAGKWLGEGLVIGIKQMGSKVYSAGRFMGEEATNSISSALDTAINLLNSDMDSQPTIRPVLDLSDVESGVGYLSGMFNNGPSIGVMSNLRAISSGMNTRSQNGQNDDVVSAINKLRDDLGNAKGDTYNVDGITYDDGSNITDAVKTLVKAVKVGRRM